MKTNTISVRIDRERLAALEEVATSLGVDRDSCVTEAIAAYLEMQQWPVDQIKMAIAEADAGDFASEAEMQALNDKYRTKASEDRGTRPNF